MANTLPPGKALKLDSVRLPEIMAALQRQYATLPSWCYMAEEGIALKGMETDRKTGKNKVTTIGMIMVGSCIGPECSPCCTYLYAYKPPYEHIEFTPVLEKIVKPYRI